MKITFGGESLAWLSRNRQFEWNRAVSSAGSEIGSMRSDRLGPGWRGRFAGCVTSGGRWRLKQPEAPI